jgi:hypothetical protein
MTYVACSLVDVTVTGTRHRAYTRTLRRVTSSDAFWRRRRPTTTTATTPFVYEPPDRARQKGFATIS